MRQLKQVDCPRGTTRAAPAGLHLMLIDLKQPLVAGTHFPLRLKFKNAGQTTVEVTVESRQ
jgi:copper(I)-binding protein